MEILGYLGTVLVIISFLCKNITNLRVISIIACIFFIIYSSYKFDIPVIITNIAIMLINIYRLIKEKYDKNI